MSRVISSRTTVWGRVERWVHLDVNQRTLPKKDRLLNWGFTGRDADDENTCYCLPSLDWFQVPGCGYSHYAGAKELKALLAREAKQDVVRPQEEVEAALLRVCGPDLSVKKARKPSRIPAALVELLSAPIFRWFEVEDWQALESWDSRRQAVLSSQGV